MSEDIFNTPEKPPFLLNEAINAMRQEYRLLTDPEKALINDIKAAAENLYEFLDTAQKASAAYSSTAPRCLALAKTKLEEAVMWAVKGITA